ncbi:MAG: response regulator [Nitrospirae bacterium]|nr:response regulator [Nitrospirota bacterium]
MDQATILVVEDETIVAKDIQQTLCRLGYDVPATATSGEEALRKTGEIKPDLVVMDIVLKGPMDGVDTAHELRKRYDVPVVYLTAYADDHTLRRAKATEPAGYLLKPFQPSELRPTIEMALYRSHMDRHMKESLRWLATTVRCVEDGVITTDRTGLITYLNPAAELLTGWDHRVAMGHPLEIVFALQGCGSGEGSPNDAVQAIGQCCIVPIESRVLIAKDGSRCLVQGRAAPVVTEQGGIIGAVVVCHALAEQAVRQFSQLPSETVEEEHHLSYAKGVINLCAWCKRVPDGSGEWYDLHTFITERSGVQFNGGLCPDCMERCFPPDHTPSPSES